MNSKTQKLVSTVAGFALVGVVMMVYPSAGQTSVSNAADDVAPPITHNSPTDIYDIEISIRDGSLWDPKGVVQETDRRCPLPRVLEVKPVSPKTLSAETQSAARLAAELECKSLGFAIIQEHGQPLDIVVGVQDAAQKDDVSRLIVQGDHDDVQVLIELETFPGEQEKQGTDN